jgi:hypothetical protein
MISILQIFNNEVYDLINENNSNRKRIHIDLINSDKH